MPEKLITVREAAELLGIPRIRIRELVDKGDLPAYKIGGRFVRFRKEQVEAIRTELLASLDSGAAASKPAPREGSPRIVVEAPFAQSFSDSILDFLYFNDFYLSAALVTLLLLFLIFR